MVRTNWRAVLIGFAVIAVLGIVSAFVEPLAILGTALGAIVGGFAAGYYAHGGMVTGAWNGLLAGSIGAIVLVAVLALFGLAVSVVSLSLGGFIATIGLAVAALALVVFAAVPATLGGALGGMMSRVETTEMGASSA